MAKKGVTPVIATVLIIALVILIALIVLFWSRGFIREEIYKFGRPIEEVCKSVLFDAQVFRGQGTNHTLEVTNKGNVPIHYIEIKLENKAGPLILRINEQIQKGDSLKTNIDTSIKGGNAEKLIIYPSLLGTIKGRYSNKVYTCLNKAKTILLTQ